MRQSYLLDFVSGATVAFSFRKMLSSYNGNCIRLRRASDNAESDFGFVGASLDTVSATTWAGGSNVYFVKGYDQTGNGNDAVQNTIANQPEVDLIALELVFDGVDDYIDFGTDSSILPAIYTMYFKFEVSSSDTGVNNFPLYSFSGLNGEPSGNLSHFGQNRSILIRNGAASNYRYFHLTRSSFIDSNSHSTAFIEDGDTASDVTKTAMYFDTTLLANSTTATGGTPDTKTNLIVGNGYSSIYFKGSMKMIVLFNEVKTQSEINLLSNLDRRLI